MNGKMEMRDEDKPFICYRQGRWRMKIVPRNAAGWRAFTLWMIGFFIIAGLFIFLMSRDLTTGGVIAALIVYLTGTAIWAVTMIRWMKARSEIVDLDDLLALKRDRDRQSRSGRR